MAPSPALFPPADNGTFSWPAPNYIDPEQRGWGAPAGIIAMCIVTFGVVGARLWARFWVKKRSGVDDWLIIAAMPGLLGLTIATVLALTKYGFNLHIWDQTPATHITIRQITMAMEVIYLGTSTFTKLSILTFYRRLSASVLSRPLLIAIWTSIVFVAAFGPACIFALIFTCSPVEAYWFRFTTSWLRTHKYHCTDEVAYLVAVITISTIQDFIACLLPLFVVCKLRLPTRQKLGLAVVFLLGFAVCATGALRINLAHKVLYYTQINPSPTYDISWDALASWVSTAVETNVAIICASLPALNAYFKGWFGVTGYEEREFGWYHRPRWSPWSSAQRGGQNVSQPTPLSSLSWKEGNVEVVEAVKEPSPTTQAGYAGSMDSGATLNRQDSIAPILRGG
ncbi:hypothetical protein IQ06DRAFT_323837 [Phaeosphaeriaceae sp. SRC1lsM3a]|nr:hypothetical protein IQ06DRAFT_323837 [Stagonospora sp. SRC1lsM3a]